MTREALLVVHAGRRANQDVAAAVVRRLASAGIRLRVFADEWDDMPRDLPAGMEPVPVDFEPESAKGVEVVLVLGGDGTLLRAAELARPAGVPLLGVNLGRVGFLAEADPESLDEAVSAVIENDYHVEERMTVEASVVINGGGSVRRTWALNEAAIDRTSRGRILDVVLEVDGRPVTGFGCDGVLCATPTGSTAYAFSAGGPVIWPEVEALLMVPLTAHALFARPLVISPRSQVALEIDADGYPAVLVCDGRRTIPVPPGARVELARGDAPVRLVRLRAQPFTDRLVRKFSLPVRGWRGPAS
ncbi:NAD kinase [Pseudonocardia spinosispora]|uniref:NAD kinase n=1 Tax=Pseudonocardia spinosispora TaxID=103441 RepID=UPI00048C9E68|nr:NAD kinase [Pseudonocardia spinosispora]